MYHCNYHSYSVSVAGLRTPLDVLLLPPHELARKLQLTDAQHIIDIVSRAIAPVPTILNSASKIASERITTGDDALDTLLGGGFATGAIWEVAGERWGINKHMEIASDL